MFGRSSHTADAPTSLTFSLPAFPPSLSFLVLHVLVCRNTSLNSTKNSNNHKHHCQISFDKDFNPPCYRPGCCCCSFVHAIELFNQGGNACLLMVSVVHVAVYGHVGVSLYATLIYPSSLAPTVSWFRFLSTRVFSIFQFERLRAFRWLLTDGPKEVRVANSAFTLLHPVPLPAQIV